VIRPSPTPRPGYSRSGTARTARSIDRRIEVLEETPPGAGVTDHGALTGLADDDHAQYATADGARGNFEASGAVATHAAAADPHTGYQKESEKGAANGYASLNGSTVVPPAQLGSGSGGATKFLREDSTFQTVSGGGAHASTHQAGGGDTLQVQLNEPTAVTGVLDETNGGTGQSTCAKGEIIAGSGSNVFSKVAAPSTNGQVLTCDTGTATTLTWGTPFVRINSSSGAAGDWITWQKLSANAAEITSQTPQVVMSTTGVGAGTWRFRYTIVYRSGDTLTTNGLGVAVNHTGTTGTFAMSSWHVTSGGAAATGLGDQAAATTAGQLVEGKSERAKNTCTSATAGVQTGQAAADMLFIVEGIIVVTVSGTLELKVRSELAAVATDGIFVRADSCLELHKIG